MSFDVLTMGEALVRFTPPNHQLFEQSSVIEWHIGGSELNTAVGLARMGLQVAWLSRLTNHIMGQQIENTLLMQGVDTSHIIWTPDDRLGTYYMEEGIGARASQVTYDRAQSAMSNISPDDIDVEVLLKVPPRLFHTTGITVALSQGCAATVQALVAGCQQAKIPVSFDFNYRSKLWSITTAIERCTPFLDVAAIIFMPARDALTAFGHDSLTALHDKFPQATIVLTRGAEGAAAITPDGKQAQQSIFPTETVCRVGGGDAFAAGVLYGYLQNDPIDVCLRYGAAVASLKYSLAGDMPLIDRRQVLQLVASDAGANIDR